VWVGGWLCNATAWASEGGGLYSMCVVEAGGCREGGGVGGQKEDWA